MKKIFIAGIIGAMLLTGCSKNKVEDDDLLKDPPIYSEESNESNTAKTNKKEKYLKMLEKVELPSGYDNYEYNENALAYEPTTEESKGEDKLPEDYHIPYDNKDIPYTGNSVKLQLESNGLEKYTFTMKEEKTSIYILPQDINSIQISTSLIDTYAYVKIAYYNDALPIGETKKENKIAPYSLEYILRNDYDGSKIWDDYPNPEKEEFYMDKKKESNYVAKTDSNGVLEVKFDENKLNDFSFAVISDIVFPVQLYDSVIFNDKTYFNRVVDEKGDDLEVKDKDFELAYSLYSPDGIGAVHGFAPAIHTDFKYFGRKKNVEEMQKRYNEVYIPIFEYLDSQGI
ncbi:MAG: hypothetical protein Q4B52_05385 [Tissierellia bacterium]|nr:hypothetical protein [Tissierellia bacterium]